MMKEGVWSDCYLELLVLIEEKGESELSGEFDEQEAKRVEGGWQ
jgi:hypothetical protein